MLLFPFELDGSLSVRSKSPTLTFPFPYRERPSPNPRRQNESHPHSVMEGRSGEFFVPDLGADTVWIVHRREEDSLEIAFLSTVMAEQGLEADDCPCPRPDSICVVAFTKNIDIGSGEGGKSGPKLEKVTWVETGCDVARAMNVSRDGKFVAVAGQKGGGVEIYEVEGEHGEKLSLVAKAANLENIADLCWL
jgi:6-phosphogluconolactonase (cycloisomerase 2 family)